MKTTLSGRFPGIERAVLHNDREVTLTLNGGVEVNVYLSLGSAKVQIWEKGTCVWQVRLACPAGFDAAEPIEPPEDVVSVDEGYRQDCLRMSE